MKILRKMLLALARCCDCESSRYALGGIHFERVGDKISAVATDGAVMALVTIPDGSGAFQNGDVRLSGEDIQALCDVNKGCKQVDVHDVGNSLGVPNHLNDAQNLVKVALTQVEGRFPRWRDVIPPLADSTKYRRLKISTKRLMSIARFAESSKDDCDSVHLFVPIVDSENAICLLAEREESTSMGMAMLMAEDPVEDFAETIPALLAEIRNESEPVK